MLEIFLVYVQDIIIRTEDDGYIPDSSDLTFSDKSEPLTISSTALEHKICIFKIIRYHIGKFSANLQKERATNKTTSKKFEIKNIISNFTA
jgi:hypothetical protein